MRQEGNGTQLLKYKVKIREEGETTVVVTPSLQISHH